MGGVANVADGCDDVLFMPVLLVAVVAFFCRGATRTTFPWVALAGE